MTADELTGNDYVSIPSIRRDGAMAGVNVLHGGLAGLVEWSGGGAETPLLQPQLVVDDVVIDLAGASWRRLDRWIPAFEQDLGDGLGVRGTICAPGGYPAARGFLLRFELDNRGHRARRVELRMRIHWHALQLWVATPRPLEGRRRLQNLGGSLCLATDRANAPALALRGTHETSCRAAAGAAPTEPLLDGAAIDAGDDTPLHAILAQTITVEPQRRASAAFFIGAGREIDGARTAAMSLQRWGPDRWIRQARLELSHMIRSAGDPATNELLNRNLLFNRYFAVGRGIDDDRLHLLRSRSTRCAAPAVFNEREALLWTLPSLMLADQALAREAIFLAFDTFSERSGEYLRYIDGGAFDTGFAADQFLLYPWIADHYVRTTGDESLLDEPLLRQIIVEADAALYTRLHQRYMLCATELLSSGDAADYPYATFANALLWAFCNALSRLWTPVQEEPPLRFEGAAAEVAAAVWQHCTTDVGGVSVLVSSCSLEGEAAVYDDPNGSLALLPFFEFCDEDDPIWRDTMQFLRSDRYPLWRVGAVPGLATRSDPARGLLAALCADLLGPDHDEARRRVLQLRLPSGVAAGAYSPASAEAHEPHHAALAGFLAWSLIRASERGRDTKARAGRARR